MKIKLPILLSLICIFLSTNFVFADDNSSTQEKQQNTGIEDLEKKLYECVKIENSIKRLECYDTISQKENIAPKESHSSSNQWEIIEETSKMDDNKVIVVSNKSIDPIQNKIGKQFHPNIVIRCSEKETDFYVNWDMFIGINNVEMTHRIDKEKAKTTYWNTSTDHTATFSNKPIAFVKSLYGHKNLVLRITPYNSNPRTAEFDITGIEEIIKPIAEECGWNKSKKGK